jgi:hypothetical protein
MPAMKVAPHVRWRKFERESVLLDLRSKQFVELNEVATRVFEGVLRGEGTDTLVDDLCSLFEGGVERALLEKDVTTVIEDLVGRGLVESDGRSPALPEPGRNL